MHGGELRCAINSPFLLPSVILIRITPTSIFMTQVNVLEDCSVQRLYIADFCDIYVSCIRTRLCCLPCFSIGDISPASLGQRVSVFVAVETAPTVVRYSFQPWLKFGCCPASVASLDLQTLLTSEEELFSGDP